MDDSHLTMMERRAWTQRQNRHLPARFRDVPPQPQSPLPPESVAQAIESPSVEPSEHSLPSLATRIGTCIRRVFTTIPNRFGLFRRYYAMKLPSYDPEEHTSMKDLSNI